MSTPTALVELKEALPASARRAIYVTYGVVALVVSATQVGFAAAPGGSQPSWLTVTLAVVAFLATPITALAVVNVPPSDARRALDADGDGLADVA